MNYGIPDVIHLHGSEFKKWFDESNKESQKKIKKLLKESSAFIVLGNEWDKAVKQIEPKTKTVVVSNTIHLPEQIASWNDEFQVLFLGVLIQRKGVADLLQAINLLQRSEKIGNAHFVISGSGAEEDKLINQANNLKLDKYVEFIGWTAGVEKTELLCKSQMLILPSYNEGLPIAILEAISYGLPIVATDVGDISAVVKDGINGYLIEPGNIKAMAEAISNIIIMNKETYGVMSAASRRIAERFSDEKYFRELKQCYECIGDRKQ